MRMYRIFKYEVEQEIGELEKRKVLLMNEIKSLTADADSVSEKIAEQQEQLLRIVDIPPQPETPKPLPNYKTWCKDHALDEYVSYNIIKKKREEEQEKKRQAAYAAEKEEYEKALAICSNWLGNWGLINELKAKLSEKDSNEEQLIRITRECSRLSEKLKRLMKEKADSDDKHKTELSGLRESFSREILFLKRELSERDKEIDVLEDMLYGNEKAESK